MAQPYEDDDTPRPWRTVVQPGGMPVVIRGLEIDFGDLVMLILKVTLASIPAGIIVGGLGALLVLAMLALARAFALA